MIRTVAGSRPTPLAASTIVARTAATRAATASSAKELRLFERPSDLAERQADHVGERAVDSIDQPGPDPLDGIGAGLVARLPGGDVGGDRLGIERPEADARHHDV